MGNYEHSRQRTVAENEPIDLNQVRAFIGVVEEGSFTAAGRSLGLPKSSVSRSVTALERSLGVRLLQRSTRAVHPTDAGSTYYQQVRVALDSLNESAASVRAMGTEPRGRVRISCPTDTHDLIAGYVAKFVSHYPRVQVHTSFSSRHVDLVAEGFDLALRGGELQDSSLVVRRIMSTDLGVYAAPTYLRRRGAPRTPAELAHHEAIGFNAPSGSVRWTLSGPEGREESVDLRCTITTDLMRFACDTSVQGLGLVLVPEVLGEKLVESDELERVLPGWRRRGAGLSVVSPSRTFEPLAVRLFKQGLIEELTALYEHRCGGLGKPSLRTGARRHRAGGS
jgi:DNA-binding transcriptional LysR family regulator